jgi:hypothetical protein
MAPDLFPKPKPPTPQLIPPEEPEVAPNRGPAVCWVDDRLQECKDNPILCAALKGAGKYLFDRARDKETEPLEREDLRPKRCKQSGSLETVCY